MTDMMMKSAPQKPPAPRAFALVVIVVVGVAAVTIATAVVFTAGGTRILSTKTAATEQAQVIAESGLERAAAYAKAVIRNERDFDKVLDPDLAIDCASPPASLASTNWGVPRYTGQTVTTFGGDRRFSVVPFNGGAYLTRFDDDADDDSFNFNLGPFTSNNNVGAFNCAEGPPSASGGGAPNGNNPFRDRNRGVWATVIGIYPGTDPATAKHTITLRRFIASNERVPVPIVAADSISMSLSTQEFDFCSSLGDVAVDGPANIGSGVRACGFFRADGPVTPIGAGPPPPVSCTPQLAAACGSFGKAPNAGPSDTSFVEDPMDYASSCNFLLVDDDPETGLYFWDGAGSRNGVACAARNGLPVASRFVRPSADILSPGNCWIPIMAMRDDNDTVVDPFNLGEVDPATRTWRPDPAPASFAGGAPITTVAGGHMINGGSWPAFTKPDWRTCNSAALDFTWSPPDGGGEISCDGACDGNNAVFEWGGFNGNVDPGKGRWHFPTSLVPRAAPAGVYRFDGANAFTTLAAGLARPAPDEDARDDWPAMTLVYGDDARLQPRSGTAGGPVGVGTSRSNFPSLVVLGDLRIVGDWAFAGSVYASGDIVVEGTVDIYGLIRARDRLEIVPGHKLSVFYDNDLITDPQETIIATPTRTRTLP